MPQERVWLVRCDQSGSGVQIGQVGHLAGLSEPRSLSVVNGVYWSRRSRKFQVVSHRFTCLYCSNNDQQVSNSESSHVSRIADEGQHQNGNQILDQGQRGTGRGRVII